MIPKIVRGEDFAGVLLYASRKGPLIATNIIPLGGSCSPASLGHDMQLFAGCRPDVLKPVLHIALRLPVQDAMNLVDADFLYLAGEFMDKMGLSRGRHQYAIYKHDPDHVHLIINRINVHRKTWPDGYSYLRAMNVCRELEIKHNLTRVTSDFNMFGPRLTRKEAAMEKRTGRACPKRVMYDTINEVIPSCRYLDDMAAALAGRDITMYVNPDRGVSFARNGFAFAGGRISRSLTLPCILERLTVQSSADVINRGADVIPMLRSVRGKRPGTDRASQRKTRDSNGLKMTRPPGQQSSGMTVIP